VNKFFASPQKFAEHLFNAATAEIFAIREGLVKVAEVVEKEAKNEIGHLQKAKGPFPAWEELADATKAEKERLGYVYNRDYNPLFRTGELRASIQSEINMSELYAIVGSKSPIAAYQEFGTTYIPPRPYIGPAFYKNRGLIAKIFGKAVLVGIAGGHTISMDIGKELGYHQDIKL